MSVPQFGGWDGTTPVNTNYSMVFSQARANRKQQKSDIRSSIGNEQELIANSTPTATQQQDDSVMVSFYSSLAIS